MKDSHSCANFIREFSLRLVHKAQASHIGSALSITDLLAVLFTNQDIFYLPSPEENSRDRLLLSKGHACVALYSALYYKKFFTYEELFSYGDDFSIFMNHASHFVPGIELSTGALGHALSVACGKCLAAKLENKNWRSIVILSDGELQEGSNWEALMFAAHYKLDNLIACIDFNNLQSLTTVDKTISLNPLHEKFKSFGCEVKSIDGHNHKEIYESFRSFKSPKKPKILILNTTKGKGISFMENSVDWHYKSPTDEQLNMALKELG